MGPKTELEFGSVVMQSLNATKSLVPSFARAVKYQSVAIIRLLLAS